MAFFGCATFVGLIVVEMPLISAETSALLIDQQRRLHFQKPFPHAEPPSETVSAATPFAMAANDRVRFGLWDSANTITPLQLTVAVSMAIGVDESKIHVAAEGSHFFTVEVQDAPWLLEAVNAAEGTDVLSLVNTHAAAFHAKLVVSHQAIVVAATSPPPSAVISTPVVGTIKKRRAGNITSAGVRT